MDQIKELHKRLLELMVEIDKVCHDNGLKYTLMGGSLIGAIRHNGFIPWDDDLDMGLLYPDYCRLIEVMKDLKHPWLTFDYPQEDDYDMQFVKIYDSRTTLKESNNDRTKGIFVDVFPIIPLGNSVKQAKRRFYIDNVLKMARYNKSNNSKSSLSKTIVYKFVGLFFTKKGLTNLIQKRRARFANRDYRYYSDPDGTIKGIVPKDCFDGFVKHKFETTELMIVKNYDRYLTLIFGDYMKLPPEDKRVPGHFEYLDLNKSYLERK